MNKINLKKEFIEAFESTMERKGFLRKDKTFHRIANGKIVQLLSYYKYEGAEFTVQFSIQSLCSGTEYSTFMDGIRMCEVFQDIPSWEYEGQPDGLTKYMQIALKATKEKLFQLFDSMIDYRSYLEKIDSLGLSSVFSNAAYMINMALGNYELCKKSRETFINNRIEANQRRWGTDHHISPSTQRVFEQECEQYYRVKKAMDNNDRKYIERYICDQERKSLKSYVKAFSTPSEYETFLNTGVFPFDFVSIPDPSIN